MSGYQQLGGEGSSSSAVGYQDSDQTGFHQDFVSQAALENQSQRGLCVDVCQISADRGPKRKDMGRLDMGPRSSYGSRLRPPCAKVAIS